MNVGGWFSIARYGGSGYLEVNGGTVNVNNHPMIVGEVGNGYMAMYGGWVYSPGGVALGQNSGSYGQLNLNGGTLDVGGIWKGSGNADLTFSGGTLMASGDNWNFISGLNSAVIYSGGATIDNGGHSIGITQTLSGTGGATFNGSGWTTLRQNNTYSGDTVVNNGVLQFYESGSLYNNGANAGNIIVNSGGSLYFGRQDTFGNADTGSSSPVSITLNGGGINNAGVFNNLGHLTLNNGTLHASGGDLSGWGAYELNNVTVGGSGASYINSDTSVNSGNQILLSRAGTTTFNVGVTGDAAGDLLVSARLTDGNGVVGSLTKTGLGTMVLSGANTYSGLTRVQGGKLTVNGSIAGALQVDSGATLGGSGTIGGNAVIYGTHSPGNSPGLQSFSSGLTYKSSSTALLEFTQNATTGRGTSFDGINVGGNLGIESGAALNLLFNGAGSAILWSDAFWKSNQSWLLYQVDGTTTGNFSLTSTNWQDSSGNVFNTSLIGSAFSITQNGQNLMLTYAVPEPSTYALLGLGAIALIIAVRKRGTAFCF